MSTRERPLPGIRFETRSPVLPEALPRMDIAAFVGFAQSGPLDTPVPVEDAAAFAALYGDAPTLAWDDARGAARRAQLAPAVRSFFRGGGRRCWVVRVAGAGATANTFPLPGLVTLDANGVIAPARLCARSEGSWSDALEVAATLLEEPIALDPDALDPAGELAAGRLSVRPPRTPLGPGDLLRLRFADLIAFAVVESARAPAAPGAPLPTLTGAANRTQISLRAVHWMQRAALSLPELPAAAHWLAPEGEVALVPVALEPGPGDALDLLIEGDATTAPPPGALLRLRIGAGDLWLSVHDARALPDLDPASPPGPTVRLRTSGLLRLNQAPAALGAPTLHRLTMELWTRTPDAGPRRLSNLGFAPGHPRWWDALPSDRELFAAPDAPTRSPQAELWAEVSALWPVGDGARWPLAGGAGAPTPNTRVALPLALDALPTRRLAADLQARDPLERDGLAAFDATLFLDPDLVEAGAATLLENADFLRDQSPAPRPLRGLHAALAVEEITLIAAPDAAHPGWDYRPVALPTPPDPAPPPLRPEWFGGDPCAALLPPESEAPPLPAPLWQRFLLCGLEVVPAPTLTPPAQIAPAGRYELEWTAVPGARYELEEAALPTFADARTVQSGPDTRFDVSGRAPGDLYYRVRARRGDALSNWSAPAAVRVSAAAGWVARPTSDAPSITLLAVQRALLRLCAARGDLFALLALPDAAREDDALAHVALLKSAAASPLTLTYATPAGPRIVTSLPLGFAEARAFSFGALYTPWLLQRDPDAPANAPAHELVSPEGAACGVLARRARARGAWVAPANEILPDVVALSPSPDRARLLDLQQAQVNAIRQEPRGFLALAADTLSDDPALRLIHVRRLLILLRRLALRLGARYVFEPNSASFRRLVERGFEALLEDLFLRGAFAGATPQAAYQVVTDDTINPPPSVEAGRFVVELRVAPALPLRFLTVRLVQTPDRTLVTE